MAIENASTRRADECRLPEEGEERTVRKGAQRTREDFSEAMDMLSILIVVMAFLSVMFQMCH